jgi:hypothetical protein
VRDNSRQYAALQNFNSRLFAWLTITQDLMSKQLAISAAFSTFAMAAFALFASPLGNAAHMRAGIASAASSILPVSEAHGEVAAVSAADGGANLATRRRRTKW